MGIFPVKRCYLPRVFSGGRLEYSHDKNTRFNVLVDSITGFILPFAPGYKLIGSPAVVSIEGRCGVSTRTLTDTGLNKNMDIKVTTAEPVATLSMSGRFDFGSHRSFKQAYDLLLPQKAITRLEINLADVTYMDSSALGMLLLLHERAQAEGKEIVLTRANPTIRQTLDIANFGKLFTIN